MNFDNLNFIKTKDQVKFIIKDITDYEYAKMIIKKYDLINKTNLIFTPVDGIDANNLVSWVLKDGLKVRIGLQIHKIIWGNKQGV